SAIAVSVPIPIPISVPVTVAVAVAVPAVVAVPPARVPAAVGPVERATAGAAAVVGPRRTRCAGGGRGGRHHAHRSHHGLAAVIHPASSLEMLDARVGEALEH